MRFLIAGSYTKSLASLTQDEQNLAKQSIFDFQVDSSVPSLNFHRVHKVKDKNFWSFRVNDDIRTIVYKRGEDIVICYIDHHDKAYRWASNNQVKIHPKTGAAQFVKSEERIQEVIKQVEVSKGPAVFKRFEGEYLLALGVPPGWLQAVQQMTANEFLDFSDELPDEAAEHLMMLVEGQFVPTPTPIIDGDPFLHPDARRRFVVVGQDEHELHQALNYPLDEWMVFLHPKQQDPVQKDYRGAARISGGAGTGKTVVALHRVAFLVRGDERARVLLTTFSKALASRLEYALGQLLGDSPARQQATVQHLHQLAFQYYPHAFTPLDDATLKREIVKAMRETGETDFSAGFLMAEWHHVIDAYDMNSFNDYRQVARVGRGTPLQVRQRMRVWKVLDRVRQQFTEEGRLTFARLCHRVADELDGRALFSHVIADETQDFGPAELRLLRTLAPDVPNSLMLVGDNGQRIYTARASLKASGIDIMGRSHILKLNYRTTEQIRRRADRLMPKELIGIDGDSETRATISLLRGPEPEVLDFASSQQEIDAIASRLEHYLSSGFQPRDIALFARTNSLLEERVQPALTTCGYPGAMLSADATPPTDQLAIGTMHRAKGLEFKIVIVMACEAGVIPLPRALSDAPDEAERKLVLEQERNLLYVAATRAREQLLISYVGAPSEFLGGEFLGALDNP